MLGRFLTKLRNLFCFSKTQDSKSHSGELTEWELEFIKKYTTIQYKEVLKEFDGTYQFSIKRNSELTIEEEIKIRTLFEKDENKKEFMNIDSFLYKDSISAFFEYKMKLFLICK